MSHSKVRNLLASSNDGVEVHSLANHSEEQVTKFIQATFAEPLVLPSPRDAKAAIPKCTLVVGAGKLERQKYDDALPKWTAAALKAIGYHEDQGASAVESSAGTFKYQHDTGKNEKYVHVYPKVEFPSSGVEGGAGGENGDEAREGEEKSGREKAEEICLLSPLSTFKEICEKKIVTWSNKRRLQLFIRARVEMLERAESKLTSGTALGPEEQAAYEAFDKGLLLEKIEFLRDEMKSQIDAGKMSRSDVRSAIEHFRGRIAELERQLSDSQQQQKQALEQARKRLEVVEKLPGDHHYELKYEAEVRKLMTRARKIPMKEFRAKAGPKGVMSPNLIPDERKLWKAFDEIQLEIEDLAKDSQFWFEEEADLSERLGEVKAGRLESSSSSSTANSGGAVKIASSNSSTVPSSAPPKTTTSASTWSTVTSKSSARSTNSSVNNNKKKSTSSNTFQALGGDDSDDDN